MYLALNGNAPRTITFRKPDKFYEVKGFNLEVTA
jgi:hypothetical protein